jgi:spore germination cell wall hydrolase CwlJ-like protein
MVQTLKIMFFAILSAIAMLLGTWLYIIIDGATTNKPRKHQFEHHSHIDPKDVEALALNLYHESRGLRGEFDEGWRSIAGVVFNRLNDKRFPKTVPEIVYERNSLTGTCAFSWFCDNLSDTPNNRRLYEETKRAAYQYLFEYKSGRWVDPTNGAHSYHSTRIAPNSYFERLRVTKVIWNEVQGHYFYSDPM